MQAVKISPKFQVVIPRRVRESMQLKPGQRVQVIEFANRIELVPIQDIKALRGMAKGIDTSVERDNDRV